MKIIITGGQGFLGQRLAKALLAQTKLPISKLLLLDISTPQHHINDPRVEAISVDLRDKAALQQYIQADIDAIFHLAAIVSSQAEEQPDLGYEINFLASKNLLDLCRAVNPQIRFIFASSLAVYGGDLPEIIQNNTALTPQSTYGVQKAMCELLINDYTRKGFVDGIVLRLPTICIRPGKPNQAASSFVSSIMREPLCGETANCPVDRSLALWLSSPDTVVANFIHSLSLPPLHLNERYSINLPGFSITVEEMLTQLATIKGQEILQHITYQFDRKINDIVASWPAKIDISRAISLGFMVDDHFADVIHQFINHDL
ncbi:hypothetical protein QV06_03915 [Gallibacterium genomosp. 3]|uniref:NAD-dependent epimerase/dehydratase domain-containing protein n=1 Tax=Gallibacterium genomosp. 3 TaxID=505345 RepID=A0A1A7PVE3_9PAST|nr:D-erythronate dehydrogenase [Gallibacterium genomosp. 3]OBX05130.1 hypothetical protein QV06_03915 [Gallibacterium genomosp. 3]